MSATVIEINTSSRTEHAMGWSVVLHNCSCHSFADVESALQKVIHCSKEKAGEIAKNVHTRGLEVVYQGHKERAEAKYFHLGQEGLEVELVK